MTEDTKNKYTYYVRSIDSKVVFEFTECVCIISDGIIYIAKNEDRNTPLEGVFSLAHFCVYKEN